MSHIRYLYPIKGVRRTTISEKRKAWSHAISNSEDVPCTKWPPARRSKGVEKQQWFIRNTTGEVEGGGGGVKGPGGAYIFWFSGICIRSYEGELCAHSQIGPTTRDDSTDVWQLVVAGLEYISPPCRVRQKQKQQQQ